MGLFLVGRNHLATATTRQDDITIRIFRIESDDEFEDIEVKCLGAHTSQDKKSGGEPLELTCGVFFYDDRMLAVCDNRKRLLVWQRPVGCGTGNDMRLVKQSVVERRCTKLVAVNSCTLLGADKSGDVFRYDLIQDTSTGELLMGHCSMLMDMLLTSYCRYLVTCDRDEKIRVSKYPNTYVIETFCLGHTEFVSSIDLIDEQTLVSGSGDGTIRIWELLTGKQLSIHSCEEVERINDRIAVKKLLFARDFGLLFVIFYNSSRVIVYKLSEDRTLQHVHTLDLEGEPRDVIFDCEKTRMWVLVEKKLDQNRNCLLLKLYDIFANEIRASTAMTELIQTISNDESFSQCPSISGDQLEGLYKHWFNNVETYLQKKEERIQIKTHKRVKAD